MIKTSAIRHTFREIIRDSRSLGIILTICTIISIVVANSGYREPYIQFWNTDTISPDFLHLPHSFLHWINDGLMAIFFFLAGLEIKRELLEGELKEFQKALLPIFAAIGGMVVPAILYQIFTNGTAFSIGWGIPMATDIAFSLGIASLLGKRVPLSLKVFLTALAIIDDLGAIVIIALFYGGDIQWAMLGASFGILFLIALLAKMNVSLYIRLFLGLFLWYFMFRSGIHASIAGVALAFTIPVKELGNLEHTLHIPVNFIILPVFALANTAIRLDIQLVESIIHPVNYGIITGLVIGKPLGILLFCSILIQLKWGKLPTGTNWRQLVGIGMLAGIGFTMSIFIATLAFHEPDLQNLSKLSVLFASLLSAIAGSVVLYFSYKKG